MDYAAWLDRLRRTVAARKAELPLERQGECKVVIEPPLTSQQLVALRNDLDIPLPKSVAQFLTRAASRVVYDCPFVNADGDEDSIAGELFNYWYWEDRPRAYEEEFLGALKGMPMARDCAVAAASDSWLAEPDWVLDRALWRHALPLTRWPNTDGVALWRHDPEDSNPGVIWLSHDDQSGIISPNFDAFLRQLEFLGYVWGDDYRDEDTGMIDLRGEAAAERRRLLGWPEKADDEAADDE